MACLGLSTLGLVGASCGTTKQVLKATVDKETIKVPLDNFLTANTLIIKNKSLAYDILLVKKDASYTALQMRCSHNDYPLTFSRKKLTCNSHGSEFDLNGKVLKEPAARSLSQYKTTIDEQHITIHLNHLVTN